MIMATLLFGTSAALAVDGMATNKFMSSGAELDDILAVVVSTNSPLRNLAANISTNLQVSLPPCDSPVPYKTGNVVLAPFNDSKDGLRLSLEIETRTPTVLIVRADVNYFDPKRGYANCGAEWKRLEFAAMKDGHWRLSKDLGGAIK